MVMYAVQLEWGPGKFRKSDVCGDSGLFSLVDSLKEVDMARIVVERERLALPLTQGQSGTRIE